MDLNATELRSAAGLLALQALPRIGPATAIKALRGVPSAERAVRSVESSRIEYEFDAAVVSLDGYRRAGVEVISFFDATYPDRLRDIPNPPPVLFARGQIELLRHTRLVAVVGTRDPSSFGRSAAETITAALAASGFGIVSGLARGVDTIAHLSALAHTAPTISVLGGGLDTIYPAENAGLAHDIVESGGLLVSEQPFGAEPRPYNLVARDRIQSALSLAVVVAQSGIKSGTMHTVRFAALQGRPVYCPVPSDTSGHPANEGLRALLETPSRDLCDVLPAWKSAGSLCQQLSERPLATPVTRATMSNVLATLSNLDDSISEHTLELPLDSAPPNP